MRDVEKLRIRVVAEYWTDYCFFEKGEKLVALIPFGYGTTQGVPHKSKSFETVCEGLIQGKNGFSELPDWFERGVKAALLAPTAMNQQKFKFCLDGTKVTLKKGRGFETKIDFGIVKYHFEAAAGKENFRGIDFN